MTATHDFVDLDAAIGLRVRSTAIRVAMMAVIAVMLFTLSDWRVAPLWWTVYAFLQYGLVRAHSDPASGRGLRLYALSAATYIVAGLPAWHLWTHSGELGVAAAVMFLCGMLMHLVVSSLGAKQLFWASAGPLVIYLVAIPPMAFGADNLLSGMAASGCAVLLVSYLMVLWIGHQRALAALQASRRRAEASRLEAEAASQAKTDFLAVMSHEVRTPMNAVLGAADLLGRTRLTKEQKGHLAMLADGGAVLMQVLNDVLDLAKIEAGKLSIDPTNTDVHDFARRSAALWRGRALDKGIGFSLSIGPDTPQFVTIDAMRTGQIIFNLVSNALKFTESGSVALELDASPLAAGQIELVLSVRDTGIGMTEEALSRLFMAFEQADGSISRRFGGTGLGLSISQKLAQMMGGRIEVASAVGAGSTFTLRLPAALAQAVSPAQTGAPAPPRRHAAGHPDSGGRGQPFQPTDHRSLPAADRSGRVDRRQRRGGARSPGGRALRRGPHGPPDADPRWTGDDPAAARVRRAQRSDPSARAHRQRDGFAPRRVSRRRHERLCQQADRRAGAAHQRDRRGRRRRGFSRPR